MGWLVSDRPLTHETPAAYFTLSYTGETAEARSEGLAASQVEAGRRGEMRKEDAIRRKGMAGTTAVPAPLRSIAAIAPQPV